jgi:two-component system response regulator MtrA
MMRELRDGGLRYGASATALSQERTPEPTCVSARVLLVEDDDAVRESTEMVFGRMGLVTVGVADGRAAVDALVRDGSFDLVVLDLMLPGMDGLDVCREIRRTSTIPIVMLSARDEVVDIVAGLELGADDYVTKPFDARELAARIRALLRRVESNGDGEALRVQDVTVDVAGHRALRAERELELSATEFKLLVELVRHAGQVLTRDVLLTRIWNTDYLGDSRLVDMAVKRLRDKLDADAPGAHYITTVRGAGYRFERD